MLCGITNQFFKSAHPGFIANEELNPIRIANYVGLALLALANFQTLSAERAGKAPFATETQQRIHALTIVNEILLHYKAVNEALSTAK